MSAELFWSLAQPYLDTGEVEEGTIMGRPCIRKNGDFVAMPHSKTEALIVRLDTKRVQELIEEGVGSSFAPAGRVFKEWLAVPDPDEQRWAVLIREALGRT